MLEKLDLNQNIIFEVINKPIYPDKEPKCLDALLGICL